MIKVALVMTEEELIEAMHEMIEEFRRKKEHMSAAILEDLMKRYGNLKDFIDENCEDKSDDKE